MVTASQIDKALDEAFKVVFSNGRVPNIVPPRRNYSWSKRELQGYAQKGMSAGDISRVTGVKKSAVIMAARRYGVTLRKGKAGRPRKEGL